MCGTCRVLRNLLFTIALGTLSFCLPFYFRNFNSKEGKYLNGYIPVISLSSPRWRLSWKGLLEQGRGTRAPAQLKIFALIVLVFWVNFKKLFEIGSCKSLKCVKFLIFYTCEKKLPKILRYQSFFFWSHM